MLQQGQHFFRRPEFEALGLRQRFDGRPRFIERTDASLLSRFILKQSTQRCTLAATDQRTHRVNAASPRFVEKRTSTGSMGNTRSQQSAVGGANEIRFHLKNCEIVRTAVRATSTTLGALRRLGHDRVELIAHMSVQPLKGQ